LTFDAARPLIFFVRETEHFADDGYGWTCKRCRAADDAGDDADAGSGDDDAAASLPRFFREGEAEEREARLSTPSLARWKDDSRRALVCPRCGVEDELG
jgi:hypothetical protein